MTTLEKQINNREGKVLLSINNCEHMISIYIGQIAIKEEKNNLSDNYLSQLNWFKEVFKYYKDDVIPHLRQLNKCIADNIQLSAINPDKNNFNPILSELNFTKVLVDDFAKRIEQLHQEFQQFIQKETK